MNGVSGAAALAALALLIVPGTSAAGNRCKRLQTRARRHPRWRFPARVRRRPRAAFPRLAATWDLLAACLRAGLPVPSAILAVVEDVPGPEADALRAAAGLLTLGADADRAWSAARACPGTAMLARAARHTARSGSALADVADELASELRSDSADHAEAKAQRASVLIAGPLGLCFLPAFLCLGVAPVVLGLAEHLPMS
jgi:Flp pilus assembly protein TadB